MEGERSPVSSKEAVPAQGCESVCEALPQQPVGCVCSPETERSREEQRTISCEGGWGGSILFSHCFHAPLFAAIYSRDAVRKGFLLRKVDSHIRERI